MGATKFSKIVLIGTDSQLGVTPLSVTGTNTYASSPVDLNQQHNVGIQAVFVGTMSGTLSVLASTDNVHYDTFSFSPALTQPAGSNTIITLSLNQIPFEYIKVQYVNASGSGTLQCILNSKDLG